MNKWSEKEIRVIADLTVAKEILYKDVYLLADKEVSVLKDKLLYYFFDKHIFPIYQDRHFIQHKNWRPISREVFEKVLDVFMELQHKEKWEQPLEVDVKDRSFEEEDHSIEFILDFYTFEGENKLKELGKFLENHGYKYQLTIHKYMLGCKIYYKDKIEDTVEGESW